MGMPPKLMWSVVEPGARLREHSGGVTVVMIIMIMIVMILIVMIILIIMIMI